MRQAFQRISYASENLPAILKEAKTRIAKFDPNFVGLRIDNISVFEKEFQNLEYNIQDHAPPAFSIPFSLEELADSMVKSSKELERLLFSDKIFLPHRVTDEDKGCYTYSSLIVMPHNYHQPGLIHTDFPNKPSLTLSALASIYNPLAHNRSPLTSLNLIPLSNIIAKLSQDVVDVLSNNQNFELIDFPENRPISPISRKNNSYIINYFSQEKDERILSIIPKNIGAKKAYKILNDVIVDLAESGEFVEIEQPSYSLTIFSNKTCVHYRSPSLQSDKFPESSISPQLQQRLAVTLQGLHKE